MNEAQRNSADPKLPRPGGTQETQSFQAEPASTRPSELAHGGQLPQDLPQIDGVRFLRMLGAGGCGAVYLAEDQRIGRQVAIKLLHRKYQGDPTAVLREARAQGAVEHRHVVPIYQVGKIDGGVIYIVSKFLSGGTLHNRLRAGPLPASTAVEIAVQIADALASAHQKGLIHRDLKPANILLDEAGAAYVSDFGLALHEDDQRRRRDEISGTPAYMAPEQVQGRSQHLDGRTDIWGLGVILYEMLSGERPFHAPSTEELFEDITQREAKPLRLKKPALPRRLEEITLRCLRKNPADRYATADDLANDLRQWQQSVSSPQEVPAPSRRVRLVTATALLLVLVLGAAVAMIYSWTTTPRVEPPAPLTAAANGIRQEDQPTVPLSAEVALRVWGEGKKGLSFNDPQALPLRKGDQVRLDVQLTEPAHVYLYWVDANGQPVEVFPNDPEQGLLPDKPRKAVHSPREMNRGWPLEGPTGMETVIVLVSREPFRDRDGLRKRITLAPQLDFNTPQELVSYDLDGNSKKGVIRLARHRGIGKKSAQIDDPVLALLEELQKEFDLATVLRVAHVGD